VLTGSEFAVGLDIGGTKTEGVVVDGAGAVLASLVRATPYGAAAVVAAATAMVTELLAASGAGLAADRPVGVGIPGLVDVGSGAVKHAVNLGIDGEWLTLRDQLADRIGHPVVIENDVNVAALGTTTLLPEGRARDLAYLSIGTGLAAGLVLDGRLRRGVHGAAGEVGHLAVDPHGVRCTCGQIGCLETVGSGSAIEAAWPATDAAGPAVSLFRAAEEGDRRALEIVHRFAGALATTVRVLCLTVDVESVVLGGGVAQVGDPLLRAVRSALALQAEGSEFLTSLALGERVLLVPVDYPAAAVGAALLGRPENEPGREPEPAP
jgi:predicted NBD/HSP70 family sugar kinase